MQEYPVKVLLAFSEAVDENSKVLYWLINNGYPELGATANSMHLNREAFDWLMKHKYPHLAAFSKAIWDDRSAYHWLKAYKFDLLVRLTDAIVDDDNALEWFNNNGLEIFGIIAKKGREMLKRKKQALGDYHRLHFIR